ncbi:cysteine hydrolase family protein [Paludibacterium paludis]|uniref:Isochorismatase n=1 Tax=Paludibacterium paludis TaxID=1225769 RepID=A0A918P5E0_9NEIS|nr:isochorismatase family cysteine hydrolase [Paludibacterium paludis]GGY21462.1 isochorismatase [Paludibacterium paludis]
MAHHDTLLLTIDYINDICHADGKIPNCAEMVARHHVIDKANMAIAHARQLGIPIAHVKVGFQPNYANCPAHSPVFGKAPDYGVLKLGDWGTEFLAGLDVRDEDFVIVKSRIGVFYNTQLETLLRARGISHLVLAGVSTNHAVESAARDAHDRDYRVTVLGDACATASDAVHAATLAGVMSHLASITTVEDWIRGQA